MTSMQNNSSDLKTYIFQYETAKKNKQYIAAAHFCKKILELIKDKGNKNEIKFYTEKLVEMNIKSVETELRKHEFSTPVKAEDIERIDQEMDELIARPTEEILGYIGESPNFFPQLESIEKSVKNHTPLGLILASTTAIDDKGNTIKGSSNGRDLWFYNLYQIHQKVTLDLYLIPLMKKIIENKKADAQNLMDFINCHKLLNMDDEKLIKRGIEKYIEGDYISSLHIMSPRFESFFLSICRVIGLKTIKINRGKEISTETITFSKEHLESDDFKNIWSEDLCEQLKFVLFEPLGMKLRHKVAHGEIQAAECNFANCSLIIYLFITVSSRIKRGK